MELCLNNVTKKYGGFTAVNGISTVLAPGVHGLLGANGAGKTTLMRMICGILDPTEGSITFDGLTVEREEYRARLGYLPQDFGYYPGFTGRDFLLYMAAMKGLDSRTAAQKAEELLDTVRLSPAAGKKVRTYSGGMKQRLGIAQALLNDPALIVLDEPTAGLDPKERVRFRELIAELGRENVVLLSTHIVSDVEHIADTVLIVKDGGLIYDGAWDGSCGDLEQFYLTQFGGKDFE